MAKNSLQYKSRAVDTGLCLVLALGTVLLWHLGAIITADGWLAQFLFRDSDPYLYFNRVQLLDAGAGWYTQLDPRANAPEGLEQHWTRPMDVIFWVGASTLGIWLDFKDALALWGASFSALLHLVLIGALYWVARPLGRRLAVVASLIGVLQLTTLLQFRWGEAHHHTLVLLLWVFVVGCLVRMAHRDQPADRLALGCGALCGLALWVNLASMGFVLVVYAAIGWMWFGGHRHWARFGTVSGVATLVALSTAGLVEWGPGFWGVRKTDIISASIWITFGWATIFWAVLWQSERFLGAARGIDGSAWCARAGIAAGAVVATLGGIWWLAPEIFSGPYRETTELYRQVRLGSLEAHIPPVVTAQTPADAMGELIRFFAMPAVAMAAVVHRLRRGDDEQSGERQIWWVLGVLLAAFFVLTMGQRRWGVYLAIVSAIPFSVVAVELLWRLSCAKHKTLKGGVRPVLLCALVFWPVILAGLGVWAIDRVVAGGDDIERSTVERDRPIPEADFCDLRPVVSWVEDRYGDRELIAMMPAERGAEWIFRTGHGVTAVGNHRRQSGFELKHEVFGATDAQQARRLLVDGDVDLVLVCPVTPRAMWHGGHGNPTVYDALVAGVDVDGLESVAAGSQVGHWQIYEVVHSD